MGKGAPVASVLLSLPSERSARPGAPGPPVEQIPMRVALAVWDGRISPVFDVATRLRLLDVERGALLHTRDVPLTECDPVSRADEVARLGVNRLVCGAISLAFSTALAMRGVDVISFVSGDTEDAARACLSGRLPSAAFAMPGCGKGRRRGSCGPGGHRGRGGRDRW
jgi:predicted Fe-Mo cluster-binding NifX family protein